MDPRVLDLPQFLAGLKKRNPALAEMDRSVAITHEWRGSRPTGERHCKPC